MNIDPSTTKYMIQARMEAEGIVEKVEDVRVTKRNKIIERARALLASMVEDSKTSGSDLLDEVRQSVQVSEIVSFGSERLPAGPNIADSDAIIIVEGRQDVLTLLRSGIKNAIAVEGTNVPKTVQELSKERALTAFVDGDRGGDLILKELLQVAEVDFIARAPRGKEVEELTQKQIMKCLRNKIPADQYVEMYGLSGNVYKAESEFPEPKPASGPQPRAEPRPEFRPEPREPREPREERPPVPLAPTTKVLNPKLEKYRDILLQLGGSSTARLLDEGDGVVTEVPVPELVGTPKNAKQTRAAVFDGIITQRILDIASEMNMHSIVGTKMGTITKQPAGVEVWTRSDLAP